MGKNSEDKEKERDFETKTINLQEENVANIKQDKENKEKREDFSSKN